MSSTIARWLGTAAALGALLALPACDRNDVVDGDHDDMHALEVIDRGTSGQPVVATWTLDGGWEGALPVLDLSEQERVSIGFRAYDPDGDQLFLAEDGEFFIRHFVPANAPQGVVDMNRDPDILFHGDHVHVYGLQAGATQIAFELWHVDHVERATSPIGFTVVD